MKVALIGAGAVGCYLAGMLSRQADVTLIVRPHQEAILKQKGVTIEGLVRKRARPAVVTNMEGLDPPDLLILAVKSYDTDDALRQLGSLTENDAPLLVVQNGLKVLDLPIRYRMGPVLIGVASFGVTHLSTGKVSLSGTGPLLLGARKENEHLEGAVELLRRSGLDASSTEDVVSQVWRKALINCSINPLTALVRRCNDCLEEPDLRGIAERVFSEAWRVASAQRGVDLQGMSFEKVMDVVHSTAKNHSSMLQDVERGKRTEIEALNGEVCRLGRNAGIDVPMNEMLYHLVSGMGRG